MRLQSIANDINELANFCGIRDVEHLTKNALFKQYGKSSVDVLILFGGSILEGCEVVAKAMLDGIAKHLIIVGGEGHTTQALRAVVEKTCPVVETKNKTEAEIMASYLKYKHGVEATFLETKSTNCGNNVTNVLEILGYYFPNCQDVIIIQDATMQKRMDAVFKKYNPTFNLINYAAYHVEVRVNNDCLEAESSNLLGMWELDRYISLLMGEIPRLLDNEEGYGPKGAGYLAHVEVPSYVLESFHNLKVEYKDLTRIANAIYASK